MQKAEHKFQRDRREKIDSNSKQNEKQFYQDSNPVFIPKRKKKK